MSKKPVVLLILDGYGLNDKVEGNAVKMAKTPVMDDLMVKYPFVKGNASGMAVGLPDGQMGNSEVGHLNMGAGRIVYQELTRITKEIQDGDFFENPELLKAVNNCKEKDSALHFFGLLSDGGVHSHNTHLYGLLELAKRNGLEKVYVHCFLDGRDTPPQSAKEYAEALEADAAEMANGIVRYIDSRISGLWKKRKLLDMRYFLVLYVIPALLELNSDGSHRLVLALHDCWLKTHSGQDFEPMRFSEIASGFNDTVLGFKIPSGGKQ